MKILYKLKTFLEAIDAARDKLFFLFIKPLWPRFITPNQISYLRIVIAIILFVLLFYYNNANLLLIMSLFLFGAFTDLLDGSVARCLKKETKFGAVLDPIADRILIIPIAAYILINNYPFLLLVIIISEIINGLVSISLNLNHMDIQANIFGKIKMFLQSVVFIAILIFWPKPPHFFFINILWLSIIFAIIGILFELIEIKNNK